MKTISVPPLVMPQVEGNLSDPPVRNPTCASDAVAFNKKSSGIWLDVKNAEFVADVVTKKDAAEVEALCSGLPWE